MKRHVIFGAFVAVAFAAIPAAPVRAQVAWDGPLLVGPQTPPGWGIFLVDPEYDSGIGFLTTWRSGGPIGLRIGLTEDAGDDLALFGGVDFSSGIAEASDTFPLNVAWVTGIGAGIGDDAVISFPLGISLGRAFQSESVIFSPYFTPRIVLDAFLGGEGRGRGDDGDDVNLGLALDFGLDLAFDPGWTIRFAISGGDRDALGIGVSFDL